MEPQPQQQAPTPPERSVGKTMTAIGLAMIVLSMALIFVFAVGGAMLHNVLQIGGLALAIVGAVVWKMLGK